MPTILRTVSTGALLLVAMTVQAQKLPDDFVALSDRDRAGVCGIVLDAFATGAASAKVEREKEPGVRVMWALRMLWLDHAGKGSPGRPGIAFLDRSSSIRPADKERVGEFCVLQGTKLFKALPPDEQKRRADLARMDVEQWRTTRTIR